MDETPISVEEYLMGRIWVFILIGLGIMLVFYLGYIQTFQPPTPCSGFSKIVYVSHNYNPRTGDIEFILVNKTGNDIIPGNAIIGFGTVDNSNFLSTTDKVWKIAKNHTFTFSLGKATSKKIPIVLEYETMSKIRRNIEAECEIPIQLMNIDKFDDEDLNGMALNLAYKDFDSFTAIGFLGGLDLVNISKTNDIVIVGQKICLSENPKNALIGSWIGSGHAWGGASYNCNKTDFLIPVAVHPWNSNTNYLLFSQTIPKGTNTEITYYFEDGSERTIRFAPKSFNN